MYVDFFQEGPQSKIIMLLVDFGIALATAIWKACNFMELHMAKSSQLPGSHLMWLPSKVSDLNEIETLIFKIQLVQLFFFKITNWGVGGEEGSTMILCTVKQVCEKETDEDRSRLPFNIMVMTLLLPIVFARNGNKEYIKR